MTHNWDSRTGLCRGCGVPAWAVADGLVTSRCPASEQDFKIIDNIKRLREGEQARSEKE